MQQVFSDPQVLYRNLILEMQHPTVGNIRIPGVSVKFRDLESPIYTSPPILGEHTSEYITLNRMSSNEPIVTEQFSQVGKVPSIGSVMYQVQSLS
jgi:crotonobetainyl-CoA:carnitine CoA-transferase CaiB-like acyl-CoA transferase